jgi:adenylate kinase family enzyme
MFTAATGVQLTSAQAGGPVDCPAVNRIAIIGCGGSGKTYLARQLGATLGMPVTHLDALYYDRHWNPIPAHRFAQLQRSLLTQPRWIIDNYASTMAIRLAAADTVIFLDLPADACLWDVLPRGLRHGAGQHAALGVYNRITWQFLRYVLGYRRGMRFRVRQLLTEHARHADLAVLESRQAARHYLATITEARPFR